MVPSEQLRLQATKGSICSANSSALEQVIAEETDGGGGGAASNTGSHCGGRAATGWLASASVLATLYRSWVVMGGRKATPKRVATIDSREFSGFASSTIRHVEAAAGYGCNSNQ